MIYSYKQYYVQIKNHLDYCLRSYYDLTADYEFLNCISYKFFSK